MLPRETALGLGPLAVWDARRRHLLCTKVKIGNRGDAWPLERVKQL